MKITALYVYPIKALRGIPLNTAVIGAQGIVHDRRFMLLHSPADGSSPLRKLQLSSHPQCALFSQRFSPAGDSVIVRYHGDDDGGGGGELEVPLNPGLAVLDPIPVDLHGSPASAAYRMGAAFDAWFSARLGLPAVLVYIGDGRRAVLGQALPPPPPPPKSQGWLAGLAARVMAGPAAGPDAWLSFSDVAPFLVTSEASLRDVEGRLPAGARPGMYKFRPNVVVDGDGEGEWAEDFWATLEVVGRGRLALTGNCVRCTSLNVDYETGRVAEGEAGTVLKKLMKDRRVDKGSKWSPVFGRYAFLEGQEEVGISVGDQVEVTERRGERSAWDWPGL